MRSNILIALVVATLSFRAPAAEPLPVGSNPPALKFTHFPDALHAVVWRNWDIVPTERIARTVGATEDQINALAASMGLPPNHPLPDRYKKQIYITLVRKNWHLLPYDQLLTLLDMSADELAFDLWEDDFLFAKLGMLKPRCDPVRYAAPDQVAREREAQIKAIISRHFGDTLRDRGEERFAFIDQLSASSNPNPEPRTPNRREGPRFVYSYFGVYGDPLLDESLDPYPDGLLVRLADMGVNGVWLHVVLRQLAPGGPDFPEFGKDHEKRLATLRKLVDRCAKRGISIYLYMNEPRAQPPSFFAGRPEMAGVRETNQVALCTSDARVRKWMTDALAHVFKEVPGLGGVFTITASENLTNCASHNHKGECPRCSKRTESEIIGEVNAAIERGVHRGNPDAKVLCWDWGWNLHKEAPDHIAATPPNTWLLSVSEWDAPFDRGGVKDKVGEYSMSVVGPGPRALLHWKLAHERGLKAIARVSVNNTWEMSAVPWLPVGDLVAQHCANLEKAGVDGLMLSWSLGGYPSPNLKIAKRILGDHRGDTAKVLDEIVAERYGKEAAPHVRRAWTAFSQAFTEFPYSLGLYGAPQQVGPANLLFETPTHYGATMVGFPYDDLNSWRQKYTAQALAGQFRKISAGWLLGLSELGLAASAADAAHHPALVEDQRLAWAAYTHFASVANQVDFVFARNTLSPTDPTRGEALRHFLSDEAALAERLYKLTKEDSRIGFEASNHYYYTPLDLVEKVINCEYMKQKFGSDPKP